MVRRSHGDGQDMFELAGGGSGGDEVARLSRAAGFEQRKGGRAVVQSHAVRIAVQPVGNNRLHKRVFAARVPPKSNRPRATANNSS